MFEVTVTSTSKEQFTQDEHMTFDQYTRSFETKKEAVDFINEFEGTRVPMYVDKKDGTAEKVGYIFKTKESERDYYNGKITIYLIHRWVSLAEVTYKGIPVKEWKAA